MPLNILLGHPETVQKYRVREPVLYLCLEPYATLEKISLRPQSNTFFTAGSSVPRIFL